MSATSVTHPYPGADALSGPFGTIVCGVDGSRGSDLAVLQAVVLATPGAAVRFVAVSDARGTGVTSMARLGEPRAREALRRAALVARGAGVEADADLVHGDGVAATLLREAAEHDLLVVGSHPVSRFGGIALGDVAAALAHRCEIPLLVAAPADSVAEFPRRILLALDGEDPAPLVDAATAIARAHDGELQLVHVGDHDDAATRHRLAVAGARILELTGAEPVVQAPAGPPADGIVRAARGGGASLLVLGHRGLTGLRALGSVSERVVQAAPCSVLLVPHGPSEGGRS